MLYVTTRSATDTYTAHRALSTNTSPDGGHFVPFKMNAFSQDDIYSLKGKSFNQIVADVLNMFFSANLSAWGVDFAIGKNPSFVQLMNHRILLSELWHNPGLGFDYCISRLYQKLCATADADKLPGDWAKTSVRIAVLFAIYGQLMQQDHIRPDMELDIVVSAENMLMPMAVWYAKSMGLPINTVICACDESCNTWDLIHKGSFATAGTDDALLLGIEKMICAVHGREEAQRFASIATRKGIYTVQSEDPYGLNREFYCAVAGPGRVDSTINSVYRSLQYIMAPSGARCFGALQDYRAGTGISRMTLLLAESSPLNHSRQIAKVTGLTESELREFINR